MDFFFFRNVKPEDEQNFIAALEKAFGESEENLIVKIDEIRKQKKAEYDKQRYIDKKNSTMKNSEKSEIFQEERENEKEEEKEKRTKKEKEEERVKEKEEIFNICAEPEKAKPEKQIKHKYGNFQHVFLTDEDYARLQADFPDLPERIQRLDDYLENTGKVYKNHALTIRSWANKDAKQAQPKQIPKEKTFRDLRIEMESQEAAQDNFIDSFWRI